MIKQWYMIKINEQQPGSNQEVLIDLTKPEEVKRYQVNQAKRKRAQERVINRYRAS